MNLLASLGPQFLFFIIATFVLVKSADIFIENAENIGRSLKWPSFLTGVLIVAIGTSLPELATGIASILKAGEGDLVGDMTVGNVLGSNIANVFLGLGLVILIANKNIKFKQNIFHVHFPILMVATISMIFMLQDKIVSLFEGLILLGIMSAYLWFLFDDNQMNKKKTVKERFEKFEFKWQYILWVVAGLSGVIIASDFVIGSILKQGDVLIETFGLDPVVKTALATTLVAIGTSLPEMMVVYTSVRRGRAEMAIGNILGSNIFNIVMILGISSLIHPLEVSEFNVSLNLMFVVATFFVYWAISKDQEITKQEALAMICLYALYVFELISWVIG